MYVHNINPISALIPYKICRIGSTASIPGSSTSPRWAVAWYMVDLWHYVGVSINGGSPKMDGL